MQPDLLRFVFNILALAPPLFGRLVNPVSTMGGGHIITTQRSVMPEPGGPGGSLATPIFGRSLNPNPTGEGGLSPRITNGTPQFVFHLPASLSSEYYEPLQVIRPSDGPTFRSVKLIIEVSYVSMDDKKV